MAKRLGVDEATIRRTLKRLGLARQPAALPPMLPEIEEQAADRQRRGGIDLGRRGGDGRRRRRRKRLRPPQLPAAPSPEPCGQRRSRRGRGRVRASSFTLDHDPRDRSGDRALARLGLLDDAVPLFADHESLPRAGVLLAVPLLVRHGLIEAFVKVYGSLHPSFYGLRTIVVTLFLAALLRIKRPEHFKEYRPEDLGAILGLDRAPEVKTVRRKFTRLAAMGRGKQLMEELARRRIAEDEDRVAFLYIDGHVREYHGKFPLFEAKKAQRQVVTPAATDTWVHDADGEPLLVVTSEVNAKLTQVLEPILADVRRLVGDAAADDGDLRPGRLQPQAVRAADRRGVRRDHLPQGQGAEAACGAVRRAAARRSTAHGGSTRSATGRGFAWERCPPRKRESASGAKARKRYLWMREVRVLRDDGRQTPILTNRQDLSAVMVAYRIFHRWRQENYFKYMEEEFALDALVEYGAEEVPEATDRRNPQWLRLTRRLKEARAEVARLQSELGKEAAANHGGDPTDDAWIQDRARRAPRATPEGRGARSSGCWNNARRSPKRIPASDLKTLKTEKKLIADAIKMAAYQVETELLGMLQDHYARADEEGRTLLHAAFQSPARLEVAEGELRVTIAAQSSPHRTAALAALCEQLDALAIPFPGTHLRLRLAVQAAEPIIS